MSTLSTRELRRFGLTVGGVFLLLGTLSWLRGHAVAPRVLWLAGVLLVTPALVAPGILGPVQRGWMRGAKVLGEFNGRVILTIVFYVILAPIGFVLRRVRDPLDRSWRDGRTSQWKRRPAAPLDPARYEQQF
jgi:hypothetical protein